MKKTKNLGLALYESEDKFSITAQEDSLNASMEKIDEAIASKDSVGEYPQEVEGALFKVGNGTDDGHRKNALVVYKDGSSEIKGNLNVDGVVESSQVKSDIIEGKLVKAGTGLELAPDAKEKGLSQTILGQFNDINVTYIDSWTDNLVTYDSIGTPFIFDKKVYAVGTYDAANKIVSPRSSANDNGNRFYWERPNILEDGEYKFKITITFLTDEVHPKLDFGFNCASGYPYNSDGGTTYSIAENGSLTFTIEELVGLTAGGTYIPGVWTTGAAAGINIRLDEVELVQFKDTPKSAANNVQVMVGNGKDENNRSNAFVIYKDGSAEVGGSSLKIGGVELTSEDVNDIKAHALGLNGAVSTNTQTFQFSSVNNTRTSKLIPNNIREYASISTIHFSTQKPDRKLPPLFPIVYAINSYNEQGILIDKYYIPKELQKDEYLFNYWYDDGINIEDKIIRLSSNKINLGSLDWERNDIGGEYFSFRAKAPNDIKNPNGSWNKLDAYTNKYISVSGNEAGEKCIWCVNGYDSSSNPNLYIHIKDSDFSDAESFKQSISNDMLYYRLANTKIIDISQYINDSFIRVAEGGFLELEFLTQEASNYADSNSRIELTFMTGGNA